MIIQPHPHLPTADDLPDSDETSVDNELQDLIPGLLKLLLSMIWADRQDWFWGTDMGIYFDPDDAPIVPDGFLALDVVRIKDENLRRSFVLWEEQVVPILTLEVISRKRNSEYRQKKIDYAELGVRYYVIYNHLRKVKENLEIYRLEEGEYVRMTGNPIWFPEIGLALGCEKAMYQGINRPWLFWYDQDGKRYPMPQECAEQAEQKAREAEHKALQAEERASQAEAELETLRRRLRDLGVDPDQA
jgi:Uma2 family endonuclease